MAVTVTVVACLLLPLAAAVATGAETERYLRFPPRPPAAFPASFSWTAFVVIAAAEILVLAPFLVRLARCQPAAVPRQPGGGWPWWGSLGVAVLAGAWWLAWQGLPGWQAWRAHAFTPLWLGYILLVNAILQRRTGRCPLTARPGAFLLLFPASTLFWWLFEYLNQYVGNWHYLGNATEGPWHYLTAASLPFSTVLPAVFSTWALLASAPRLQAGLARSWPLPGQARHWGAGALALGLAGLLGIGLLPAWTYPMLWLAPGLVLVGWQLLREHPSVVDGLFNGDWRALWLAAVAGLVCGFFWEMWNAGALARWRYSVPLVHGMEVFRMPLLGYGGYLPFGITCLACVQALFGPGWTCPWLYGRPSSRSDGHCNG
ncbi:hypothetical protein H0Z60_10830 [Ectothiorhodospiraceae bacterium WFHF3C12]|nr:hypothetical protein [Ectothiorhodospiraceae bacterium WFHF3C12]